MSETRKYIISIIQDYCNKRGFIFESERFSLSFGTYCTDLLTDNILSVDTIKDLLKKYPSFCSGNDLNLERFSVALMGEITSQLHYTPPKMKFYTAIEKFGKEVEGVLYPAFHVTQTPQEETGRTLLQAYMRPRGFREAQMAGGNSDLIYLTERTIVETKIWRDKGRYLDGITELCGYLDAQDYKEGYYVLFDNTQSPNIVIKETRSKIYDISNGEHIIHCFFVSINPIPPSKRRKNIKNSA